MNSFPTLDSVNSFPTFDFDRFPKDGDYEDFYRDVQEFQKYVDDIDLYRKLAVETEQQKDATQKIQEARASAAASPIEDISEGERQITLQANIYARARSIKFSKISTRLWRSEKRTHFQEDTYWNKICKKAKEKFEESEYGKFAEWQTRRERWKEHAFFASYTSVGVEKAFTCIKNIAELYKKTISTLAKCNLSQDFIIEYKKYLDQIRAWKSSTKQALIYSMLARLELAAQEEDVTNDDILFRLYTQVNQLLDVQEQKGSSQDTPLCTMTLELFQKFHLAVCKYTRKAERVSIAKRVNALPWFHRESIPFGIEKIIHDKKLFIIPVTKPKKYSVVYCGPSICDLALCTIYWNKLKKLTPIGSLNSRQEIESLYKIIEQIVSFYIKQSTEVYREVIDDAKDLQRLWRYKLEDASDKIFTELNSLTECFFDLAKNDPVKAYALRTIFYKLNELADDRLCTSKSAAEYKKKRAHAQTVFGTQFEQTVLQHKMNPNVFFKLFSSLISIQHKNSLHILQRVFRENSSEIQQDGTPLLEQIQDALKIFWGKNADIILQKLIEYLVQTVTDPKSPLLSIIKQYDTSLTKHSNEQIYLSQWFSKQKTRIKQAQEILFQTFTLKRKKYAAKLDSDKPIKIKDIDESIALLKGYATFDQGPLNVIIDYLKEYLIQIPKAVSSDIYYKAIICLQDQILFYEFGIKRYNHIKQSPEILWTDQIFFELLSFCPRLKNELSNDLFTCASSQIKDVITNISSIDILSFLSEPQQQKVYHAIDTYWFERLKKYSDTDSHASNEMLLKARERFRFPFTEQYKKQVFDWLKNELIKYEDKIHRALEAVIILFGTNEQKQRFYTNCFKQVFENQLPDTVASTILLKNQLLGYSDFLEKYGKEYISQIFESIKNFFKHPIFNATLYQILKNTLIIDSTKEEHLSENILRSKKYRTYCILCQQFELIFNEQYGAVLETIKDLEKDAYKKAFNKAKELESKLPAIGSNLSTAADDHSKEAIKLLFKKTTEWLQEQIINSEKYTKEDIEILVGLFKEKFLKPSLTLFIEKAPEEITKELETLSILCTKAGNIFDFYGNIHNLLSNAFHNKPWLAPFADKDFPLIFKLLPASAKKFLLSQLILIPMIGQSTYARQAWFLLITVLKGLSNDPLKDLNSIQHFASNDTTISQIYKDSENKKHAYTSEHDWHRKLKILFSPNQDKKRSEKNSVQLLRIGSRQIQEDIWKQLFDAKGKLIKDKGDNKHVVIPVTSLDTVYYFKFLPDAPGIQWMSCSLRRLLWGEKNQTTFHIELAKFAPNTANNTQPYPVLISQAVKGKTLSEVWKQTPNIRINSGSFSREFLRILLDLEQDGKPENYIAIQLQDGTYQLVNVDGEQAFANTGILRVPNTGGSIKIKLLTKTILFCCPNMKEPIDDQVIQEFFVIDPIEFLKTFIHDIYRYNTMLLGLFSSIECDWWRDQKEPHLLKAPLRKDTIQNMYTTICRIQYAFQQAKTQNRRITHIELLQKVYPLLASYYEPSLQMPIHPIKRFLAVVEDKYKVIYNPENDQEKFLTSRSNEQVLSSVFGFIPKAEQAFSSNTISEYDAIRFVDGRVFEKELIVQAQQELIDGKDTTWKEITSSQLKEQVLHGIPGLLKRISWEALAKDIQLFILQAILNALKEKEKKLSLRHLNLSHSYVLTNDTLKQILEMSPELMSLDISYCRQIDETTLRLLPHYCPSLKKLKIDGLLITEFSKRWWDVLSAPLEFNELRYLSCSNCKQLGRIELNLPKLSTIQLKNCIGLTKLSLQCPNFAQANLEGCVFLPNRLIGEKDITIFNTTKALQNTIEIDFHEIRKDLSNVKRFREGLERLKGVTDLVIKNPYTPKEDSKTSDILMKEMEFVFDLLKMYGLGLKYLNVSGCLWVDDSRLKEIITVCPKLERLFCAHTKITNASKNAFYLNNLQLKEIDISDTRSGDMTLSTIVMKCPRLEHIKLSRTLVTDTGIQVLMQNGIYLKEVDISECREISDRRIASLLEDNTFKSIRVAATQIKDGSVFTVHKFREYIKFVKFYDAPNIDDKAIYISEIGYTQNANVHEICSYLRKEHFRYIKVLDLSYCTYIESLIAGNSSKKQALGSLSIIENCSSLEKLNIEGVEISDEGLEKIAHQLSLLKEVNISACIKITDHGLISLLQKCTKLEVLHIHKTEVRLEGIAHISTQLELRKIDLSSCTKVTDDRLVVLLEKCPNLEELNLSDTRINLKCLANISQQLKLKKIDLSSCTKVTDDRLVVLLEKCPNLEELNLKGTKVSLEGIANISHRLKLRKIDLSYCTEVTDDRLVVLLKKYRNLEEINLKGTKVSLEGIANISNQLKLRKIDLSYCTEVTDDRLIVLLEKCPNLEELNLFNKEVSLEGLAQISHQLKLRKIDLPSCKRLTDDRLVVLLEKCPNLEELNLFNTIVSLEGLARIPHHLNLRKIDLSYCKKVTANGLMVLLEKCPNLEEVYLFYIGVSPKSLAQISYQMKLRKIDHLTDYNMDKSTISTLLRKKHPYLQAQLDLFRMEVGGLN